MRWIIPVSLFALSACSFGLPGRQTLAPAPRAPKVQSIAATRAFAGRIPLVTIAPGTEAFEAPLKEAVAQALAIKPDATFEVRAAVPQAGRPDAEAKALGALLPLTNAVARAVAVDGVQPGHVTLTASTGGKDMGVLVYVK